MKRNLTSQTVGGKEGGATDQRNFHQSITITLIHDWSQKMASLLSRRNFVKAAGVFGALAAVSPFESAHAGDRSAARAVKVPQKNAVDNSVRAVQIFGASASRENGIVLAVYGRDKQLLDNVKTAAKIARGAGLPVRGIIVGPTSEQDNVELYVNSYMVSRDGALKSVEDIENAINLAYGENNDN